MSGDADHNGFPDLVVVAREGSWPSDSNRIRFFKETSSPASLTVTSVSARGGEKIRAGSVAFVDWISGVPSGGPGAVGLELSTTGAAGPWTPISTSLVNSGRFQWLVPAATPATTDAYVRYTLTVAAEVAVATTPAPFAILGATSDLVFADGFESGDTSAWTMPVP